MLIRQMTVCPNRTKWITSNVYRIQNQQTMKKRENVINIENVCTLLVYYRCQMGRDKQPFIIYICCPKFIQLIHCITGPINH
ncbi:hypothetical protein DERP_007675 [Dermatophagoides pteronyssinus]|uniref:Uncharacterized protein n=1 Tax=Dermatophagoides pteronyssinus TaxID=6956 RepID=A0ABQ8JKE4_DERPT|nr:hypothetical protein DERP_007675 [Dermatophagoides pteronyssinus]